MKVVIFSAKNSVFVVAALALLGLGACGKNEPASSGSGAPKPADARKVIVYTPHGQEMLDEYEAAFEAAHPGIDVIGRFVPPGQILSQLRIDKTKPQIDVWWGGTSAFFTQAKNEDLLAPYRPTWADAVPASYRDAGDAWYAQFLQVPAFMFNANIHRPEDMPTTWADALDPKWKDKIVIREPMDSGTMKTILSGIVWSMGGAEGSPERGYDFLQRLDAQTRSYLPNPQALYDRIAKSEEGYISLWNVTDIIFQKEANGYPFGYRIPEEPAPVSLDPIALVKDSPHPVEAKLFYEFVTSKENCLKFARDHFRILARTDVAPEELPEKMRALKFTPIKMDVERFDRAQAEWMPHWQSSIRDPGK